MILFFKILSQHNFDKKYLIFFLHLWMKILIFNLFLFIYVKDIKLISNSIMIFVT